MPINKTEAFILRQSPFRDSSKMVTFFTRDFGKIRCIAKGARRLKNGFGASLEIFSHCDIIYYHKDQRELQTLAKSEILHYFSLCRLNLHKTACLDLIVEIVDRVHLDRDRNISYFDLLHQIFYQMEQTDHNHFKMLSYFILKTLDLLGYRPTFSSCVRCREALVHADAEILRLSTEGRLCERCSLHQEILLLQEPQWGSLFTDLENLSLEKLLQEKQTPHFKKEITDFLIKLVSPHLHQNAPLKSYEFFKNVAFA